MSLQPITFTQSQNSLGGTVAGADYISGMLHYTAAAPSGFTLGVAKEVFGTAQLASLGISNTYSDETQATGTITLVLGAVGDTINVKVTEPGINGTTNIVNLGTYTVQSTDTTSTILAASVAAFVNLGTPTTGYTATSTAAIVTIKARVSLGIALNTGTPLAVVIVGTTTATLSQFSGGVASKQAAWYYQISEFFRLAPTAVLWVGFFAVPSTYNFSEITTMQTQALGVIRQFGVYSPHGTSVSNIAADLDALQIVLAANATAYMPCVGLLASNISGITNPATLANLRLRTDPLCTYVLGQDGGGQGAWLFLTTGASVPAWGAALGTEASANVSQDIGAVGAFNISNGTEDAVLAIANGNLITNLSANLLNQLDSYGYLFLTYFVGTTGSYWNDSPTCISTANNFCYIERNRTIQKVQRTVFTAITPLVRGNIYANSDGTIAAGSVSVIQNAINPGLKAMVAAGNISEYQIVIPTNQNVASTSTLNIEVDIVGVGIARFINVALNLVVSI